MAKRLASPKSSASTSKPEGESFGGALLERPQSPPPMTAAEKAAEDLHTMQEREERQLESFLDRVQSTSWFDEQVALARKAGRAVTVDRTANIWAWKHGTARFQAEGLKRLYWLDPVDGKEKSNVLLQARVLDAQTKGGKEYVGKSVLVPMPYTIGRAVALKCGATIDRNNPPSAYFDDLEKKDGAAIVVARCETFVAYVETGSDGLPTYENIRGGRRFMRDVSFAVL